MDTTAGQHLLNTNESSVITSTPLSTHEVDHHQTEHQQPSTTIAGLPAQQQQQHQHQQQIAFMNGARVLIDPTSLTSLATVVPSNVSSTATTMATNANADATAAAITLTTLQNKVELLQNVTGPISTAAAAATLQSVIVQGPNSIATSAITSTDGVNLPRVLLCDQSGKPVTLTQPIVTLAKNFDFKTEVTNTVTSSAEAASSSSSSSSSSTMNLISRPIDLLTSVAFAAANVGNVVTSSNTSHVNNVSTTSATTTTETPISVGLNLATYDLLLNAHDSNHNIGSTGGGMKRPPEFNANDEGRPKLIKTEVPQETQ